ncbi:MFS transporter [Natrarchaeobius halalkaliphilus]|uniref:MFS transporter n=1 Tax=Natrarchaeobius halalkaliphilus TaxID=1679091 RepID=UPI001404BE60|nr:MFS transporter [Natrarchaeobius halalkaliphilus]
MSYADLLTNKNFGIIILVSVSATIGTLLPPALPGLATGLGVSEGTIGYVITVYKLPSILIIPVAAAVADIYGRRTVLLPSLILFGGAGTIMFFAQSFSTLLFLAVVLGTGAAAIYPLTVTLLGDFFEGRQNSAGQGIRVGMIGLGMIFVPVATGYLAEIRWNYPFILFLFVFPVVGIVHLSLSEPLPNKIDERTLRSAVTEYAWTIRKKISEPSLAILVFGGFTRGFTRYALVIFVPLFAVSTLEASLFQVGLLLSIPGAVYVVASPFSGELLNWFKRKQVLFASFFVSGFALFLLPFVNNLFVLAILILCHTAGDAVLDPVMKGTVTSLTDNEHRAGIVNTLYVLKRIGQTTAPAVLGFILATFNYSIVFASSAVFVGIYLLLFAFLFSDTVLS